jgi:hypothetical protein
MAGWAQESLTLGRVLSLLMSEETAGFLAVPSTG